MTSVLFLTGLLLRKTAFNAIAGLACNVILLQKITSKLGAGLAGDIMFLRRISAKLVAGLARNVKMLRKIALRMGAGFAREGFPCSPAVRGRAPLFLLLLSCFLVLVLAAGCKREQQISKPPPPKVTVSQPTKEEIIDYLEFSGNTQAVNTVLLRARVEGYLDGVYFKDGDMVRKDQLLFLIQQNTYFAQLQQSEGNVQNQKSLLDHAKTEYARFSKLYEQKAAADTDVENWRNQRDTAQAGLISAEAQRDLAKLNLGYTWVVAPFTGRLDRRLVDPGNLVGSAGSDTILAELTQIDPLYVYFNIPERAIPSHILDARTASLKASKSKQEAEKLPVFMSLANEEGFPHEGYLDFSASSVSTSTGTLLLRGVFANPDGRILPGQFGRMRLPLGKKRVAVLVPQVALQFDQLGAFVLVVNDNNTVERRNVRTGSQRDYLYIIEDGLTGDEWVVTNGLLKAVPGRQVSPERSRSDGVQKTADREAPK
jgi:RND family efflux transporter MFP subunit